MSFYGKDFTCEHGEPPGGCPHGCFFNSAHDMWMKGEAVWPVPESIAKTARTPLPDSANRTPGALWAMVDVVAEAYQVPRDLPLLLVLAILATCVGGRRRVRITADWVEVLSIYATVAVPSGERKSPVLAILAAPLLAVERELADAARPDVERQRAIRDVRAKAVEKIKAKGDTSADALANLDEAVAALNGTEVPAVPRLLADDSTPEAMAAIMAEQDGRLGVLSAEGGLFATLAGRYANGIPNLDLVLKAWSGDPCRIDRVSRGAITLPEPVLSVGLAIQPDVLAGLAEARHFRGSGLLARFLFALPDSLVGARKVDPDPVPPGVVAGYGQAVAKLAETVRTGTEVTELKLTEPARAVLNAFRAELEPRLHPEYGDLANIADWANKLPGELVRVAALLSLFADPDATEVDEQVMSQAVELAPYLTGHALAAFDLMGGKRSPWEPARAVLRWLARKKLSSFTIRTAWRELSGQSWATDTDAVREAVADLEDLGWVRPAPRPDKRGPGRPSEPYDVNPAIKEN